MREKDRPKVVEVSIPGDVKAGGRGARSRRSEGLDYPRLANCLLERGNAQSQKKSSAALLPALCLHKLSQEGETAEHYQMAGWRSGSGSPASPRCRPPCPNRKKIGAVPHSVTSQQLTVSPQGLEQRVDIVLRKQQKLMLKI